MSGLYQRALEYLQSQRNLRLVRPGDDDYEDFEGTAEERAQIETEISRAVQEHRLPINADTFTVRPQRAGRALPILVNLIALGVIAGGAILLISIFESDEAAIAAGTTQLASAEGRLLSALRSESEAQLSRKELEIADIRRRLSEVEAERERIRTDADARLTQRETELRMEFEAALEAERMRLAGQDLTEDERVSLLAEFRRDRETELELELAELQDQSRSELAAREASLAAVMNEYESTLEAALAEREAIEAELQAEIRRREAELSEERAAAQRMLDELRSQQEQRRLISDQIVGFHARIRDAIEEERLDDAEETLRSLRDYVQDGPIAAIPELQRRRRVEVFLIETLETRLRTAAADRSTDTRSLLESAGRITRVGDLIAEAQTVEETGNLPRARELYLAALAEIPAVEVGYERLTAMEEALRAQGLAQTADIIAEGNALYTDGIYGAAVERYATALAALPSPDDQLLDRLLDAGFQLRAGDLLDEQAGQAARIAILEERLESTDAVLVSERARSDELAGALAATEREIEDTTARLESTTAMLETLRSATTETEAGRDAALAQLDLLHRRLDEQAAVVRHVDAYRTAFRRTGPTPAPSLPASQLELLETKLVILRIVSSESVRADFPHLHDRLNDYLDALVAEQRTRAVRAAFNELSGLLDELSSGIGLSAESAIASIDAFPTLSDPRFTDATVELLDRLEELADPRDAPDRGPR